MPASDHKFQARLVLEIESDKGGSPTPFFSSKLGWSNLKYANVVAMEEALLQFLNTLGDWGIDQALEADQGHILQACGLAPKIEALMLKKGESPLFAANKK